ncbi:MAG: glycerophosphodiester phosphodiesterase [Treponema sp.]|jgi:glycerophosphoryl diester phosphodiesterase|nr:glycerophosphodiester phosphodiesterase [Treponema sp.]
MMVSLLPDRPRPLLFAHRGCSSLAPENTFASFRKAREIGSPGIELDVHVCASGELIVAHDDNFTRTARDRRAIQDLDYQEIKKIDVGSWFDSLFREEHPPVLDDVLEEFCPDIYIDIELKTNITKNDPLPELLAKKIIKMGDRALKSTVVSSFNPFCLAEFKKLCPHIPTAIIWSSNKEVPLILRRGFGRMLSHCDYLKPDKNQINVFSFFRFSILEGRPLVPWTVDESDSAAKLIEIGCEGIISNRPQDLGIIR